MGDFLTPFVRRSLENFDVKADGDDGKVYHFDGDVEGGKIILQLSKKPRGTEKL
ncbi:MAG: hypothetical protein SPL10_02325 [Synergistales bacterium]|nr:hypothetical protein [Synergistales bacterium]MDY6402047.1 hypothetical protein [Synergistales bacterium]MDY6404178.1 hypothetical protein [Synergistales bacterium]MDY6410826.1 hypothetical protein [Synergistales bacterium]MDY6413979.1 hypothetical protein [Synergistales bacterium]